MINRQDKLEMNQLRMDMRNNDQIQKNHNLYINIMIIDNKKSVVDNFTDLISTLNTHYFDIVTFTDENEGVRQLMKLNAV